MRIKKLLAVVLGTVLAISSFSYTSWAAGDDNNSSSVEKFQFVPGYVASELDGNTPVYEDYGMARMLSELPASYPSSVEDIKANILTIVIRIHMELVGHSQVWDLQNSI